MMPEDEPHQNDYLYAQARDAQIIAIKARRRKLARQKQQVRKPAGGEAAPDADNTRAHPSGQPSASPTQHRGRHGEKLAEAYVVKHGLEILARNLHCRTGEIDLVATDGTILVFIEVRLRMSSSHGGAAASITRQKRERLRRTAQFFMPQLKARHFGGRMPACRFDVICIQDGNLQWIRNAFEHSPA